MPHASGPGARILAWPGRVAPPIRPARTVLLVEPHADTRELYAMWLHDRGLRVVVADSAADAIETARATAPEVIVVELMLPGGGPSLIRALRAQAGRPDALIIVLTTQTQPALRGQALAAGADLYVVKPCGAPRLGLLIEMGSRGTLAAPV